MFFAFFWRQLRSSKCVLQHGELGREMRRQTKQFDSGGRRGGGHHDRLSGKNTIPQKPLFPTPSDIAGWGRGEGATVS